MHPDCARARYLDNVKGAMSIAKDKNTITDLNNRIVELQETNKTAYEQGCEQGMKMQRQKLFDTLLVSRQLLIDTLSPVGINEHRVRQFATWYETQRDARVNPKQDEVTYKTCKNIIELEVMLNEVMQDNAQLTA